MSILFEENTNVDFDFDYNETASRVVSEALSYEGFKRDAQISITIVDADEIKAINKEFRNIDKATDVLSFPLIDFSRDHNYEIDEDSIDCIDPENGEVMLGDIVLCIDKIKSQALEYNHSVLREYAFLIAHSMLHLLGYDHMEDNEAKDMERRQEEILMSLGISR